MRKLTVNRLLDEFLVDVESRYSPRSGNTELDNCRVSYRELRKLHGGKQAVDLSPADLKSVQMLMCRTLSCNTVNGRVGRIRRAFRWAVVRDMVPVSVLEGLRAVEAVRPPMAAGREPVGCVSEADVQAVRPHLGATVRAMVDLMLLTGMRPGEVVVMEGRDVDRSVDPWRFRPRVHKGSWRQGVRTIPLGPRAQEVLAPHLRSGPLFVTRRGLPFTVGSFGRAVRIACDRAGVERWAPNRLRHTAATLCARRAGVEAASEMLGHRDLRTTAIYVARNGELADEYARRWA